MKSGAAGPWGSSSLKKALGRGLGFGRSSSMGTSLSISSISSGTSKASSTEGGGGRDCFPSTMFLIPSSSLFLLSFFFQKAIYNHNNIYDGLYKSFLF